jgi:hypothetical protein
MFRRVYGDGHWRIGAVQGGLAGVLSVTGDARAEALYRTALTHLERTLSPEHPSVEPVLLGLARHLIRHGDPRGAEPLMTRVVTACATSHTSSTMRSKRHACSRRCRCRAGDPADSHTNLS